MIAEANYMDTKRELQGQILSMGDLEDGKWDDGQQTRWVDLNKEYDALVADHEAGQQRAVQLAERDTRLQQLREAGREMTRYTNHQLPPEQLDSRLELRWAMATQAWVGRGKFHNSPLHQECLQEFGVDPRGDLELRWAPHNLDRGHQAWSSRGGASYCKEESQQQWARHEEQLAFTTQTRAMLAGASPAQEFVPQGFQRELEQALLAFGGIRRACRVWQTAGFNPIPWPVENDTSIANEAVIVAEAQALPTDLDPVTGQVDFSTFKFVTPPILATAELIDDSAFNIPSLVGGNLGRRLARGTNRKFCNGTGSGQPEGITINAPIGHTIPLANTTGTYDDWVKFIHSVDPSYRDFPSTGFLFNDETLLNLRLIKDDRGLPIWQPGMVLSEPDRIFMFPYVIEQHLPGYVADDATKFALFGALEKFVIRDHSAMRFYRLIELFRLTNDADAFVSMSRHDSHMIDAGTEPIKSMVGGSA